MFHFRLVGTIQFPKENCQCLSMTSSFFSVGAFFSPASTNLPLL